MLVLSPISKNDFQGSNTIQKTIKNKYYQRDNDVLEYLFGKIPLNNKAEEVYIKIVVIDFIYSTQLKLLIGSAGVYYLVDLILDLNFDVRVQKGDPTLVNDIANNNGGVNLFSFASKYCALHNWYVYGKDDYSIYDSVVARLFPEYTAISHKTNPQITQISAALVERWRQAKAYGSFNDAIGTFLDEIGIDAKTYQSRRRDFDRIIWEQRNN